MKRWETKSLLRARLSSYRANSAQQEAEIGRLRALLRTRQADFEKAVKDRSERMYTLESDLLCLIPELEAVSAPFSPLTPCLKDPSRLGLNRELIHRLAEGVRARAAIEGDEALIAALRGEGEL